MSEWLDILHVNLIRRRKTRTFYTASKAHYYFRWSS